ncbi:MAG TPA: hypothetical protein VL281_02420 [Mycobacteriales bacterium]|nr:hypothetical protein [Mycobacteriales bacterium]
MDATPPQQPEPEEDWLLSPDGAAPAVPVDEVGPAAPHGEPAPSKDRKGLLTAAGLVVAGLVAGAVGTFAVGHSGDDGTTRLTNAGDQQGLGAPGGGQLPQGAAPFDRGGPAGGGFDGEQRLQGTLTAVGSSSVTVRTGSGTATYAVTASSELVRNGQVVSLSGLRTGEAVLVHVYPLNGRTVVERLFAGTLPQGGPGGAPPGGAVNG